MVETKTKAHEMAEKQRDIGVAEFFSRNRHLLGFDNKRKALLTTIKEAVDNALDACEEAKIMPELIVEVIDMQNDRFRIVVEDNGPGIVKKQIPNIFAKLQGRMWQYLVHSNPFQSYRSWILAQQQIACIWKNPAFL